MTSLVTRFKLPEGRCIYCDDGRRSDSDQIGSHNGQLPFLKCAPIFFKDLDLL